MRGRSVPQLDSREVERRRAVAALDIAALRVRMEADGLDLRGVDDALVLQATHEARAVDLTMPASIREESIAWLQGNCPDCATLATIAHHPKEFIKRGRSR